MKGIKIGLSYFLIFIILCTTVSCANKAEKPTSESEGDPKQMPSIVEEIETDIIGIMAKLDLIPYYEEQITEKKKKEEEKKQFQILMGQGSDSKGNSEEKKQQEGGQQEGQEGEKNGSGGTDKLTEFKPKPITINDIILADLLKEEMPKEEDSKEEEIPSDIVEVWNDINNSIKGIHEKWNSLEPQIVKAGASQTAIESFEDTLNQVTINGTEYKQMETLILSNILTSYIPELVNGFKKKFPNSIYNMKFHVRQIVLDSYNDSFDKAQEHLDKLVIHKDSLVSKLVETKNNELGDKLNTSVFDLKNALESKDINIIKIKATIVIKNLNAIKDELSK